MTAKKDAEGSFKKAVNELLALERLEDDISCLDPVIPEDGGFNVLKVMKNASHEIRHTQVLRWMLDPSETHGLGLRPPKWFAEGLAECDPLSLSDGDERDCFKDRDDALERLVEALRVDANAVPAVSAFAEYELPNKKGRIDLLLAIEAPAEGAETSERWLVGIENKVGAVDSKNQLNDYAEAMASLAKAGDAQSVGVFLTLQADDPVNPAHSSWLLASYEETVGTVVDEMLGSRELDEGAKGFLQNYRVSIGRELALRSNPVAGAVFAKHRTAFKALRQARDDSEKALRQDPWALLENRDIPRDARTAADVKKAVRAKARRIWLQNPERVEAVLASGRFKGRRDGNKQRAQWVLDRAATEGEDPRSGDAIVALCSKETQGYTGFRTRLMDEVFAAGGGAVRGRNRAESSSWQDECNYRWEIVPGYDSEENLTKLYAQLQFSPCGANDCEMAAMRAIKNAIGDERPFYQSGRCLPSDAGKRWWKVAKTDPVDATNPDKAMEELWTQIQDIDTAVRDGVKRRGVD